MKDLPMLLETPKGLAPDGQEWDTVNMKVVRDLAAGK
jgi:hypothetical protein